MNKIYYVRRIEILDGTHGQVHVGKQWWCIETSAARQLGRYLMHSAVKELTERQTCAHKHNYCIQIVNSAYLVLVYGNHLTCMTKLINCPLQNERISY